MRQQLVEYLEENGIEAQYVDTDVLFSVNDLNFICRLFPDDPYFIQLVLPNIDETISNEDIIADINKRFKVAKIIEVEGKPWIVADSFVFSSCRSGDGSLICFER